VTTAPDELGYRFDWGKLNLIAIAFQQYKQLQQP